MSTKALQVTLVCLKFREIGTFSEISLYVSSKESWNYYVNMSWADDLLIRPNSHSRTLYQPNQPSKHQKRKYWVSGSNWRPADHSTNTNSLNFRAYSLFGSFVWCTHSQRPRIILQVLTHLSPNACTRRALKYNDKERLTEDSQWGTEVAFMYPT